MWLPSKHKESLTAHGLNSREVLQIPELCAAVVNADDVSCAVVTGCDAAVVVEIVAYYG